MKLKKEISLIWQRLQNYKKKVYFISLVALISSFAGAAVPYIYGRLVDIAIQKPVDLSLIFKLLLFWLTVTLFSAILDWYVNKKGTVITTRISNDLVIDLNHYVLKLPISFHKDKKMGEILQRISRAANNLEMIIERIGFHIGPRMLRILIIFGVLVYINWQLALILLFIVIFYAVITLIKSRLIVKEQKKMNKAYEKGYGELYNSVSNIQVVKSSTGEDIEKNKNIRNFNTIAERVRLYMIIWSGMNIWQALIFGIGFVCIFGSGIYLLINGAITPGQLVMFIGYTNMIYSPMGQLSYDYRMLKRSMTVIQRAMDLYKTKTEDYDRGSILKKVNGEIVFQNVSFDYSKKKIVLNNISFKTKPGQVVALVGKSGAGKTTLVDLISRYYSPQKGKILIDGKDIQKIKIHCLRDQIAIVPQEITLFNDTVKNNIKYAKPGTKDEEMIKVSKIANAHEFIQEFPKEYNQLVGERGIKLSTGQKQRIAIARALLRDPKILILDEATSNLDSASEKLVQEALRELIKGRTTFVIAHRLSTVSHADKILVIDKGKIVESGNHSQLMRKKDGIYRGFYLIQSATHKDVFGEFPKTNKKRV